MKRTILVAIVVCAAVAAIYYMVTKWQDDRSDSVQTTEEREILGLSTSGPAVSAEPAGESEADEILAASGQAAETGLESKGRTFTDYIIQGLTARVLDEASEELKKQTTVRDINLSFESVTSSLGSYIGVDSVTSATEKGYRTVTVSLRYEGNDGATIRYVFDGEGRLAGLWFDSTRLAASVEKGSRYEETPFSVGRTPFVLDGILTLPVGAALPDDGSKPPVVILLSDRDDADRDGTIGENSNKPLRDVAHGLALRGVASIRYPRRLNQYADTAGAGAGIREYLIKDAWAAIDAACGLASVDTDAIYVLAWGRSAEYLQPILEKRLRRVHGAILIGAKPAKHMDMSYLDEATKTESDARFFMGDHSTFPLLLIQGERDYETPVAYFDKWQSLFTGRSHTAYHRYKQLGHYLWPGSAEPSAADYNAANRVADQPVADIANWCVQEAVQD